MTELDEKIIESYRKTASLMTFENKQRLCALYEKPTHTRVNRTLTTLNVIFAAIAVCAVLMGAAAGVTARDYINAKTSGLSISDETRNRMERLLEMWHIEPYNDTVSVPINANSFGETYGTLLDGVDLIAVGGSVNGERICGYVYRTDYGYIDESVLLDEENNNSYSTLSDVVSMSEMRNRGVFRNWVYVYDVEGIEVLGKFAITSDPNAGGFKTNEQLEDPDVSRWFADGKDSTEADDYRKMAAERSQAKRKQLEEKAADRGSAE